MDKMPKWADFFLVPLINLTLAFFVAGLVVLAIGQNPIDMVYFMVKGALGATTGIGYTLYYATNFIFTGLAFAVAMHARLFNIGGEGQAAVGGLSSHGGRIIEIRKASARRHPLVALHRVAVSPQRLREKAVRRGLIARHKAMVIAVHDACEARAGLAAF